MSIWDKIVSFFEFIYLLIFTYKCNVFLLAKRIDRILLEQHLKNRDLLSCLENSKNNHLPKWCGFCALTQDRCTNSIDYASKECLINRTVNNLINVTEIKYYGD